MKIERRDVCIERQGKASIHQLELMLETGQESKESKLPIVFLPGYGNGAAIFATAWHHWAANASIYTEVHGRRLLAVDLLGNYASSRPSWTPGLDVKKAEEWFVEALEAWREAVSLEKMVLLGHSIGGIVACSYAERYPQRVDLLLLLSPAGVPREPADYSRKLRQAPVRVRFAMGLWARGWAPHDGLRLLPSRRGKRLAGWAAKRWVKNAAIDVAALGDYIYYGLTEGAKSGERCIAALLNPGAWGKLPLCDRIPKLKVPRVEFIYGEVDWMDARHGNAVAEACRSDSASATWVQLVPRAGHYPHLENVEGFSAALQAALARDGQTWGVAEIPHGFADRFSGPNLPPWRNWEGYDFGR